MNLDAILTRLPVDRVARRVTSQAGAATVETAITRDEIIALVARLCRKQRLLKFVLGIKTKSQHTNTTYKASKRIPQYREATEPRAMAEYLRCGREIHRLSVELAEMRRARRFVSEQRRRRSLV